MTSLPAKAFARDRFTWLAYVFLAAFTYLQAILGPLMPFLRSELHLSYTLGGLHLSAFAAGMIAAGLTGDRLLQVLDVASARVTLGAGLAICTAPLALGSIADQMGIKSAYGATLVLIAAIMLMLRLARRVEVA